MVISSLLFAPGVRPDRFDRALASDADLVCLDLEDSVPPDRKDYARAEVVQYLSSTSVGQNRLGVRVNALDTPWCDQDLAQSSKGASFILLPKVNTPQAIRTVRSKIDPDCALWPMIESPAGLQSAWEIAAEPGVAGLVFGAFDYVAEVGCAMEWEPLLFARSLLAAACAKARVELMDAPSGELVDVESVYASTIRSKALGFTSRACIHPAQIDPVKRAFMPSEEEISFSKRVVQAFEDAKGAPVSLNGRLVELPVFLSATRLLSRVH